MLAAAMIAVLLSVTGAGAWVGAVVVARHRAQSAADLAALAAAAQLPRGAESACARARAVATRVGGVECWVDGLDVVVTVQVPVPVAGAARASARAGPTDTR
ncbi:helicase [Mycobacterium asiaticum]|uniref:Helicase n=1 Tax=Mycobacterium asiaticum TaxID=1790 RepID=A0A1A3CXT4_MYCAS|nr:Rv3654c family TadE-like protein [Mycobacterium asiaticum]OBI90881.1 helicase [Mycobacterium asiaticum]